MAYDGWKNALRTKLENAHAKLESSFIKYLIKQK